MNKPDAATRKLIEMAIKLMATKLMGRRGTKKKEETRIVGRWASYNATGEVVYTKRAVYGIEGGCTRFVGMERGSK